MLLFLLFLKNFFLVHFLSRLVICCINQPITYKLKACVQSPTNGSAVRTSNVFLSASEGRCVPLLVIFVPARWPTENRFSVCLCAAMWLCVCMCEREIPGQLINVVPALSLCHTRCIFSLFLSLQIPSHRYRNRCLRLPLGFIWSDTQW